MAANDEKLMKDCKIPTPNRNDDASQSKLMDLTTRQPPKTGAATLDKDGPAHPEDQEMLMDSSYSNVNEENRFHTQQKSSMDNPERLNMTPSTISPTKSDYGYSQTTEPQNLIPLESSMIDTTSHNGSSEARFSYAGALMNQKEIYSVLPCKCNPTSPTKAIKIPISMANTYHQAAKTLIPHGQVEAISLNPISQLHTAIFYCGCQATKAKASLKLVTEPFIPPTDFESEYNPRNFFKNNYKRKQSTETASSVPIAPTFPRFFCIIPKNNPSTIEILAYLSREIGPLQPNSMTRVQNHFTLRVEKDSQSLMITKIDVSNSKVIQKIYPHTELNTSKAVCYNREFYRTTKDTIKLYTSPQVQEVHQIKGANNITILTFPTPQPPQKIEILGLTLNLEPYREKPKQCKKCFSYMHKSTDCRKEPRCNKCSTSTNNHANEECNKNPFCYLCKGNHPPTSRSCPIYVAEEELLNEALKRGCGRGHIRAERRRAGNLIEEKETEPRPSHPSNQDGMENRNVETPAQPGIWTEKPARRKRRRETTNQSMSPFLESPSFELPSIYREESSNIFPNDDEGKKTSTYQKNNPQNITRTNLPTNPHTLSPTREETMEVSLKEEQINKNNKSPQKTKPSQSKLHSPDASSPKKIRPKNIKTNQLLTQERKMEKETGSITTPNPPQPSFIENPVGDSTREEISHIDTYAPSFQPKAPITSTLQTHNVKNPNDLPSKSKTTKRHPNEEKEQEQPKLNNDTSPTASSREPPKKRGKQGSPTSQNTNSSEKTPTPPSKIGSKKSKRCSICKTNYKTLPCFKEHQAYFHPYPGNKPKSEKIPNHDATRVPRDHKCSEVPHERCLTLYKVYRGSSEENSHLVDSRESIYDSISHFRRGIKRSSSAVKQTNKEKIYGPQTTDNSLKRESTQPNIIIPEQSQGQEAQKPPPEASQHLDNQRMNESPSGGNIVKNVVAKLEVARKKHLQLHPFQSTWPNQLGNIEYKIQYSPSTRDPRLRSYSDLYKLDTKNSQPQDSNNPQSKVNQDSQLLHRTLSLNSLHDPTVQSIQTLISTRKDKSVSHATHHNLK